MRRAIGGCGCAPGGLGEPAAIVAAADWARVGWLFTHEVYGRRRGPRPAPAARERWCPTAGSEHVVAGARLVGDPPRLGRDRAEPARLVVLECLDELVPAVHHEGAVRGDRLPDRLATEQE